MSRRRQSAFDAIVEMTAMMPWWVGVVLAVISYLGLHWYSAVAAPNPANAKAALEAMSGQVFRAFATAGQYFLPVLFLIGAGLSAFKAKKRRALHDRVAHSGDRRSLEQMSWQEFEKMVGEYFRHKGYSVQETGGGGADGGVDLVVSLGKDRYLVQCKQWKARQVGVAVVRELYGVMVAAGAAGGFVVTSGRFTDEARQFAEGREIEIISGDDVMAGMGDATMPRQQPVGQSGSALQGATPVCPRCGAGMVQRSARQGAHAGNVFWGCSTFPACRGTRPG